MGTAALVHDFFVAEGGGEQVALELAGLMPDADVHTSFFNADRYGGRLDLARVRTWPLQRVFGPTERFRSLLPLYPAWFGNLDLRAYDLVVSSSIAFTHAVRTRPGAVHVSYVYTPMRYAWNLDAYLRQSSWSVPARIGARTATPLLRRWDRATAGRPDVLVAISATVQERIRRCWSRESEVLYPPVDVADITPSARDDGFYLVAARMLAYRRLDHAVEACTRLGRELVVVGDGPERARLHALAGPRVRFLGRVDRPTLLDLFGSCHAYLVPGEEDFGIAPVEAMAAGKPVVALRAGGVAETVIDGVTGVLYDRPGSPSMAAAIEHLETLSLDPLAVRRRAEQFDVAFFRARWRELFARLGVDPSLYSPS